MTTCGTRPFIRDSETGLRGRAWRSAWPRASPDEGDRRLGPKPRSRPNQDEAREGHAGALITSTQLSNNRPERRTRGDTRAVPGFPRLVALWPRNSPKGHSGVLRSSFSSKESLQAVPDFPRFPGFPPPALDLTGERRLKLAVGHQQCLGCPRRNANILAVSESPLA